MLKNVLRRLGLWTDAPVPVTTPSFGDDSTLRGLNKSGFIGAEINPAHYPDAIERLQHAKPEGMPRDLLPFYTNWTRNVPAYPAIAYHLSPGRWKSGQ